MKTLKPILADFDLLDIGEIINNTNKRVAENERRSYYRTVENWNDKPVFHVENHKTYSGGVEDYRVYTDSLKYLWIDEGTDLHTIQPHGDYPLKVRGFGNSIYNGGQAYYPKTTPNRLTSDGIGEHESDDAFLEVVKQQIEPRNFTIMIKEKAKDRWVKALDTEIKKYVNKKVK